MTVRLCNQQCMARYRFSYHSKKLNFNKFQRKLEKYDLKPVYLQWLKITTKQVIQDSKELEFLSDEELCTIYKRVFEEECDLPDLVYQQ